LYNASELRIVGGNLRRDTQDSNTFISTVSKIVPHRDYDRFTLLNDIGLITVSDKNISLKCDINELQNNIKFIVI
jgi:hypothetical protein